MSLRKRPFAVPFLIASCLAVSLSSTLAFASGDDPAPPKPKCTEQQVWNPKTNKCDPLVTSTTTDDERADYAYSLAKDKQYQEALNVLNTLKDPNTAKALNYRGYATRKLGRTDEGIGYYLQAVELDPNYAQVREYLGEAYVIKGRLDLAQEQLQTIKSLCGTQCEEYEDLADAIAHPTQS
ncbi:tetratricopeptide repeat protein [Pseudomonas gingeri]|uniref:tetratricopeptide repeat protein n=1 Tax=Pseudomonas gingeri TaxID=117681 RepID=UPI0015A00273|nr:tetratricopeptide repeat protein [Pseudomonas gingeri]NWD05178.1 tetratricopeptide repeat protein [Pseudomonas gingeri]NWE36410.1 tetratricopeptide repeat protein [Pseudomonas gingeri]NWE57125.1 tetratricopeptide repeat protein [Pseudomonas gingeri]NWF00644.1 tetratricopeptide repeat protein [Pseudomonas gingeri]